jgi:hypothetical protein
MHAYRVCPRKDKRGFDLISDAPAIWSTCGTPKSRTQSATQSFTAVHMMLVIRVYDESGNVIETQEHAGEFKEW